MDSFTAETYMSHKDDGSMMIRDDFSWSPSPAAVMTTTVVGDSTFADGLVSLADWQPRGFREAAAIPVRSRRPGTM
jgi:hypothetical protein